METIKKEGKMKKIKEAIKMGRKDNKDRRER